MSDYLSGQVTFSGLGSGTDFTSIVKKLVEIEGVHKKQMESWKSDWTSKMGALTELNTSMTSLRTTLVSMDTMNTFMIKNATATDSTVLTATASADAEATTHSIQVQQMAQNAIWMSESGVADASASLGTAESFFYSYCNPNSGQGTEIVEIKLRNFGSLNDLTNLINADPNNPGVKANIVSNGTSRFLQIRGLDLGSNASLRILSPTFGLLNSFTQTKQNQDAHVKVNGWPADPDSWIRSSSNTITQAIPGLTLAIKDTGTTQVTVDVDKATIKENIQTFVDKYNEVQTNFMQATAVNSQTKKGSVLTGNYGVQLVDSNIQSAVANSAKGFVYFDRSNNSGDPFTSLSQLGILTDADAGSTTKGLLVIDEAKLDQALASNASAAAEVFAASNMGGQINDGQSGDFSYSSNIPGTSKAGIYDVQYTINGEGVIESATIGGMSTYIDTSIDVITAADGSAKGIAIKVNNLSQGTYTGKVRLKQGKAGELSDMLKVYTNDDTGPLNVIKNNYQNIVDNIDKKIGYEDLRLSRMASDLKSQYSRLDTLLGKYGEIQKSLTSGIAGLTSNSK